MDQKKIQEDNYPKKAVIIADTYTNLLNPINNELSEILLPVGNIPILEYMINFLTSSSIKEIIICSKQNKSLDNYIRKYHRKNENLIKLITSDTGEEFTDMGDCLRKISAEKIISGDFLLIRGLVITNIDLEKAFNFHLKLKEQDPNRILTSLLKSYKNNRDIQTKYDENFLFYDKTSYKIYQYESTYDSRRVKLNDNVKFKLKSVPASSGKSEQTTANYYKVRSDLYDSFIDICTPDLLDRFAENFDYHSIRDHIYKHLINSEVYTDTFYLYELSSDDYVGVIKNIETYHKVNYEILNRWAHPVVLEHISTPQAMKINYKTINMNIYIDSDATYDPRAKLISAIALAKNSYVQEHTEISSSVVGSGCEIGNFCKIKNSIIFSNCKISDKCSIINSVIGAKSTLEPGVTIVDCVIGNGVCIKNNYEGMRIYLNKYNSSSKYVIDEGDEEEDFLQNDQLIILDKETFLKNLEDKDLLFVKADYKSDEDDQDGSEDISDDDIDNEEDEEENYAEEISDVLLTGIEKENKIEDILQEISSLKNSFFEYSLSESKIIIFISQLLELASQ